MLQERAETARMRRKVLRAKERAATVLVLTVMRMPTRRNTGGTEQPSRRTSYTSWRELSRSPTTRTSTAGRNSP